MMIRLFLFLTILITINIGVLSQSVEFFQEDLKFEISDSSFNVCGLYYFRNLTQDTIRQFLIYPFPNEKNYGKIDSVVIYNVQNNPKENELSGFNNKGAYFIVNIKPKGTTIYQITYSQHLDSKKAKYILTTMNNWRNKLEKANFELSFPEDICIDSINFMPQTPFKKGDRIVWQWSRTDFMPANDVDIYLR